MLVSKTDTYRTLEQMKGCVVVNTSSEFFKITVGAAGYCTDSSVGMVCVPNSCWLAPQAVHKSGDITFVEDEKERDPKKYYIRGFAVEPKWGEPTVSEFLIYEALLSKLSWGGKGVLMFNF